MLCKHSPAVRFDQTTTKQEKEEEEGKKELEGEGRRDLQKRWRRKLQHRQKRFIVPAFYSSCPSFFFLRLLCSERDAGLERGVGERWILIQPDELERPR